MNLTSKNRLKTIERQIKVGRYFITLLIVFWILITVVILGTHKEYSNE
jgi:hypothetical protein